MGNRPTDWHVLDLDEDPVPGDPDRVKQLARELHDFADDVADALRDIKGMAGEDALLRWAGKTARQFQEEFESVPDNLKKLQRSYDLAGDAIAAYWPRLERAQSLADKALVKGREARNDLTSASRQLESADSWVDRATARTEEYDEAKDKQGAEPPDENEVRTAARNATEAQQAQSSAQSAVDSAQSELDAAKRMAADAKAMREEAAATCKDKLDEASDAGIQNRSWWEEGLDWVRDNWDMIVTVCKVIVAVLGIVVMIIGGPLTILVVAAALVVLADTLMKYMNGQASLWDVAFAALDCIPGMKGLTTLGKLAKGAKGLKGGLAAMKGLKGMKSAVLGLAKRGRTMLDDAAQGAFNRLKNVVRSGGTDPVDLASGKMFLPLTDITLPGALPLAFTRRVASDYRAGWWFGPTWSSTADQRLELDEAGIVFVTEDGLLLEYPHPQGPDEPVLPESGPRWPLTRLETGGYTVTDPTTGHTRSFTTPDEDGLALIERISDRDGHTIDFTYDDQGAPTGIHHSGGYHLKLTTDDDRITALHLANAAHDGSDLTIKRFGYTDGQLTEDINSSGLPFRYTYDDRLRVASWTDTNDRGYDYTYDEQDRCIAEGGAAGHVRLTLDYDQTDPETGHQVTTAVDSLGHTWRYLINERMQIVAETDPLGHTTNRTWDEHHLLLTETDPLGRTVCFTYDDAGRVTSVVRPDGRATRAAYNGLGLPVEVTEADGSVWRQGYDERGNRIAVTDPAGHITRFAYDTAGRLEEITDALGHRTGIRCDGVGLPAEVTDPLGGVTHYRRDAFGRLAEVTDPLGAIMELQWTVEGHLACRTDPDGAREAWIYDGEGNCTSHTDSVGQETRFEYTHFDLLTARTDPDGSRHEFTHNTNLQLIQVTNPQGLTWEYTYDPVGRLVSETDFDDRTVTYTLDAVGQLTARTTALGETITYERDVMGEIVAKNASGRTTTYAYDLAGGLLHAEGPDAELAFQYDSLGRVTSETTNGRTTTYAYDQLGRRIRRVTPTGALATYGYDTAGSRTSLTTSGHTLDFTHDPAGRETTRRIGDSLTLASVWDPAGRLAEQTLTAGPQARLVQQRSYAYRPDGCLTAGEDHLGGRQTFDLDPGGRVTAVTAAGWSESYSYDTFGNQTHATWPTQHALAEFSGERTYSGTRLTRAGQYRYEHDDAGRLTLRQRSRLSKKPDNWRFAYDAEDRLTGATTPDGTVWRYLYDPLGRRTAKQRLSADGTAVAEETVFTWDGPVLIEQTTRAPQFPDPVTLTWDHQNLAPIAQNERITDATTQREIDARFFAIVTDLVGTPRELVDETGALAWRTRTTLWGTTTWASDSTAYTPLRFPGQYHDPETGLHYNLNRYYDPTTARYTTPDPLGLTPAPNPTTYVTNPHTLIDPYGLAPYTPEVPSLQSFGSRREAFRGARRDLGIPTSQPPESVSRVPMTTMRGERILDANNQPIMTREYTYRRPDGSTVVIQEHSAGHQYGQGGVGDQGPHFNVRPPENTRTGHVPGASDHYEY